MSERYQVAVKVISQKGTCAAKHKVGDEWILGNRTPGGMCFGAFHVLYQNARVLMFGGSLPWESDPDVSTIVCPDPENPVVFELRRLPK